MGFLSGLGKVLSIGGGIAAAPFTGGASLIPSILSAGGQIASGVAGGRAAGRAAEAGINQNQDENRLRAAQMLEQALQNRAQLELQQKQFGLQAPQARAKNSARGDAMANLQDVKINAGPRVNIPQISGGLRPTLLSQNSRDLGAEMSRQALLGQMEGDQFTPMPAPNMPQPTPLPQANGLDTFLNILGGVGAGASALNQSGLLPRQNPYQVKRPPMAGQPYDWEGQGVG